MALAKPASAFCWITGFVPLSVRRLFNAFSILLTVERLFHRGDLEDMFPARITHLDNNVSLLVSPPVLLVSLPLVIIHLDCDVM